MEKKEKETRRRLIRKGSNTMEIRVRTTEEVLKLIKWRHRKRSTMNRTPMMMIKAGR